MRLFCARCETTHKFTTGQIERIIYVLLGETVNCRVAGGSDPPDPFAKEDCLHDVLEMADPELGGYGAEVDVLVESRRRGRPAW